MKILYVVSEFYPVEKAVSIRTRYHIDALLKDEHKVVILTDPKSKNYPHYNICTTFMRAPTNKNRFIFRLLREIVFGFEIGFRILFGKKFDHVIITSPPFIMTVIISFCTRLKGIPYSIDVRDRYPQVMFSLGILQKDNIFGKALLRMEKSLYKNANNVITVTRGLVNDIEFEFGISNVELVMNGFSETVFGCREDVQKDTALIVMHGNFGKFFDEKVFENIVKKLHVFDSNCKIVIIGDGNKIDILKNKHFTNVEILPSMRQEEISIWLNQATLGLSIHSENSSMRHAFPVKVFEYIGSCLPSIVLPINEAGQVMQDRMLGYAFNLEDWEDAVDIIMKMIDNDQMYKDIVKNIKDNRQIFSRESQSKKFADIFSEK